MSDRHDRLKRFGQSLLVWQKTRGFEPRDCLVSVVEENLGSEKMALHVFELRHGYALIYETGEAFLNSGLSEIILYQTLPDLKQGLKNLARIANHRYSELVTDTLIHLKQRTKKLTAP